ncbi:MAG: DUF3786 domain-containing protein [Planctomycetota bacterium]|jgi:hypothetical protein
MAHEGLWEQLDGLDGAETAQRAACKYHEDPARYVVSLLNTEYVVNLSDRSIFAVGADSTEQQADFLQQLCLLAYLINAKDLPLADKLVSENALPGGQFFFRGIHSLPTGKLEETFGDRPETLLDASGHLNGERCDFGDASIRLNMLPRVPLTIVVWRRCEEFEARASILFDKSTGEQLPLDALQAAVNLTVKALTEAAAENT